MTFWEIIRPALGLPPLPPPLEYETPDKARSRWKSVLLTCLGSVAILGAIVFGVFRLTLSPTGTPSSSPPTPPVTFNPGQVKQPAKEFLQLKQAAEQGDMFAQSRLGYLLADGKEAKQDLVEAYKWLVIAAAQGATNAARNRDTIEQILTPEQKAEAQKRIKAFAASKAAGKSK